MQIELTIKADSMQEIAHLFQPREDRTYPVNSKPAAVIKEVEPADAEPEAEETPTPKKSRSRRAGAAVAAEKSSSEKTAPSSDTTTASPSDEKVTFADLREKASKLMDEGKVEPKAIQEMLEEKFGVKAFGPLKPEQYADCIAELENLAA